VRIDWYDQLEVPGNAHNIIVSGKEVLLSGYGLWRLDPGRGEWETVCAEVSEILSPLSAYGDELFTADLSTKHVYRYLPRTGWMCFGQLRLTPDGRPRNVLSLTSGAKGVFAGTKHGLHFIAREALDLYDRQAAAGSPMDPPQWETREILKIRGGAKWPDQLSLAQEGLWIGDNEGLALLGDFSDTNIRRFPFRTRSQLAHCVSMALDTWSVWIGMAGGVARLDRASRRMRVFRTERFGKYPVSLLPVDRENALVAIENRGLVHVTKRCRRPRSIEIPGGGFLRVHRGALSPCGVELLVLGEGDSRVSLLRGRLPGV